MKSKNILFFFAVLIASLFLYACSSGDSKTLIEEAHAWVEANVSEGVANDIELPKNYPLNKKVKFEWYSLDPFLMDNEGHILGRERKTYEVYFAYYISYGGEKVEYEKVFKLAPRSLEESEARFTSQIPVFIAKDIDFTTTFYDVINVTWWSSNTDVFTNEGVYIKPIEDTYITISYILSDGNNSLENSVEVKVQGKTAYDYFNEAKDWLTNDFISDRFITADLDLPTTFQGNDLITFTWSSSNENIISNTGKVTKTIYERYCKLTCVIEMGSSFSKFSYDLVVEALDISQMSESELLEEFINNIAVEEYEQLIFNSYKNNTQSYGFIHFYDAYKLNVIDAFISEGNSNRPGLDKKTEYVVVHDTANNDAPAYNHIGFLEGGGNGTSWHYTIDDTVAYHHLPDNETAFHAGDSSRHFGLVDTGLKATAKLPFVTLVDGYYYINGQNTKLRPYSDKAGTTFDSTNWTTDYINDMGVLVEVGENGNWWMGKTWYSSDYDRIGNFGGNKNGIGIESSVHDGTDYATTVRHLAILVAKLLIENDLGVDRVQGHHYFSGKHCPNQIMNANYWEEFKNLVALEKFAQEHFSDLEFTWTSLSSNVDEIGKISLNAKAGDSIEYKVSVKKNSVEIYNNSFVTTLK